VWRTTRAPRPTRRLPRLSPRNKRQRIVGQRVSLPNYSSGPPSVLSHSSLSSHDSTLTVMSSANPNFGKVVELQPVPIPNLTIKDLLGAIPYVSVVMRVYHNCVNRPTTVHTASSDRRSARLRTCG
jgi:hypothetical protein